MRKYKLAIGALLACNIAFGQCKIWNEFKQKNGVGAQLPDFSYAGVNYSETPLPSPDYKIFNVTDFGAKPNDGMSDKAAITKAIRAAEANGSGIIQFPAGRFRILEDADAREPIKIKSGNIIFRGAGSSKSGTEIFMKNHMLPPGKSDRIPGKYGNTRMRTLKEIFEVEGGKFGKKDLALVSKDAIKGEYSVTVKNAANVKPGQWVCLTVENNDPKVIEEGLKPLKPWKTWKQIYDIGLVIREVHKVKAVDGKKVTFVEPLRFNLEADWGFGLRDFKPLVGFGVEKIAFVGNYHDKFVHHGSAIHDHGWKFWRLGGVVNSWFNDCRFKDCSGVISFNNSAYCSALKIMIEGNGGHTSLRESGSTGIFMGLVRDEASVWHGPGVAKPGIGNVFWRVKYNADRCFEAHATQPRATLFDCVEGGFEKGFAGGAATSMPCHLHDLVLWNFKETGAADQDFDFFDHEGKYWKFYPPIVVGFHGSKTTFNKSQLQYTESLGKPVNPESLFETQMIHRLGKFPSWLAEMKKEWERQ